MFKTDKPENFPYTLVPWLGGEAEYAFPAAENYDIHLIMVLPMNAYGKEQIIGLDQSGY